MLYVPYHALRYTNQQESPHLHRAVKELAQTANVSQPHIAYLDKHAIAGHPMEGVLRSLIGIIEVPGKGAVVMLGDAGAALADFHKPTDTVSHELKGVLAHEFGHIIHGDVKPGGLATIGKRFPIIGAAAGLGGLLAYNYYKNNRSEQKVLAQDVSVPIEQKNFMQSDIARATIELSKYMAAAGLGLIAGKSADVGTKWYMELRTDRVGAQLVGDAKGLASYLEKFHSINERNKKMAFNHLRETGTSEIDILKLKAQLLWLERHAHPPPSWRIRNLESMSFPAR